MKLNSLRSRLQRSDPGTYLLLLLPFVIIPAMVVSGLLIAAFGGPALLVVSLLFAALLVFSVWHLERRESGGLPDFPREPFSFSPAALSRSLLVDVVAIALGCALLLGIVMFLLAIGGGRR